MLKDDDGSLSLTITFEIAFWFSSLNAPEDSVRKSIEKNSKYVYLCVCACVSIRTLNIIPMNGKKGIEFTFAPLDS